MTDLQIVSWIIATAGVVAAIGALVTLIRIVRESS